IQASLLISCRIQHRFDPMKQCIKFSKAALVLKPEWEHYQKLKPKLLKTSENKFFVFKKRDMLGPFNSFEEAHDAGTQKYGYVNMLVQEVVRVERVAFVPALLNSRPYGDLRRKIK